MTIEDYYNFTTSNLDNNTNSVLQLIVFNPSLYSRSEIINFNIDFGFSNDTKYKAFFYSQ